MLSDPYCPQHARNVELDQRAELIDIPWAKTYVYERRMGALPSKKKKPLVWDWSGPPGEHSPYPVDRVSYKGPKLLYCFIDILSSYQFMGESIDPGPCFLLMKLLDRLTGNGSFPPKCPWLWNIK